MTGYVLALSDAEVARYQMMAQRAAEDEADQWAAAGIAAGAGVADVGCGPGSVSAVLAKLVGPQAGCTLLTGTPGAHSGPPGGSGGGPVQRGLW